LYARMPLIARPAQAKLGLLRSREHQIFEESAVHGVHRSLLYLLATLGILRFILGRDTFESDVQTSHYYCHRNNDLQRPAIMAEILMVCEVSVGRGGVLHKYLNGIGGASHSKERRASDPSPKRKGLWPRTSERFALPLQIPALAIPPY